MKKQFFRTVGGKILLFVLCVVFSCSFVVSSVAAILMLDGGIYSQTEQQWSEKVASANRDAEQQANYLLWALLEGDPPEGIYELRDAKGNLVRMGSAPEDGVFYREDRISYSPKQGEIWWNPEIWPIEGMENYVFRMSPAAGITEPALKLLARVSYALRYGVYAIMGGSLLLAAVTLVLLLRAAGRRPGDEELHPGFTNRVPGDVMGVLLITAGSVLAAVCNELSYLNYVLLTLVAVGLTFLACCALGVWLLMDLAVRVKQRSLLRKSLCGRLCLLCWRGLCALCRGLRKLLNALPLVPKAAAVLGACTAFELLLLFIAMEDNDVIFLWILEKLLFMAGALYLVLCLKRLQQGARKLAEGDLSAVVDTGHMPEPLRSSARDLNSLSLGMSRAVEEQLKSERMKTELITNVSHDIKTPLTSIINYATLISREEPGSEKIGEYSEVLVRQSERLKRLLEDLVEASKASTGNLEVQLSPCDAAVFLRQAEGEYAEKLEAAELSLITKVPEEELRILADGRRMQRIFDNLLNNICKYALPGTRVYLTLEKRENMACIAFKNTSREELNISEAELMERFVRGDSARSTEGSGLGLSIAQSLARLQGGSLQLTIDGDLFKAELSFPLV